LHPSDETKHITQKGVQDRILKIEIFKNYFYFQERITIEQITFFLEAFFE